MSLEELETVIVTRGFGLPDIYIELEDSDGDDVDLTGYGSFTAAIFDGNGTSTGLSPTVVGVVTGFKVSLTDANVTALASGDYLLQAGAVLAGRTRVGKCRLQVVDL